MASALQCNGSLERYKQDLRGPRSGGITPRRRIISNDALLSRAIRQSNALLLAQSITYRYFMTLISNVPKMAAQDFIDSLMARGRYHFTSSEAREALSVSAQAAKLAINRLRHQSLVASPARGFYVIVPPEYRSLACLPACLPSNSCLP